MTKDSNKIAATPDDIINKTVKATTLMYKINHLIII